MAELVSWSLKQASRGVAPTTGFYGEEFAPASHRAKIAGQPLAGGYKFPAIRMQSFRLVFIIATCSAHARSGAHV